MPDLKDLKVCFVAGTLGQGGAERQLFYMASTLAQAGARPHVLTLGAGEFWEERLRAAGVPVSWIGKHQSRVARVAAIVSAARASGADVIQSQHFYTNLYAVAAARLLGTCEIGAIRSNATWELDDLGTFGRISLTGPRLVAANSRAGIRNAMSLGMPADRLRFLPNVIDTDTFGPAPHAVNGSIRVLAAGRNVPQKRFDRFLSVLAEARTRSTRPIRGVLVTTDRTELQRQARDLGLSGDALEFREAVSDMTPIYQQADIFLLTSDAEGTPNVVLEAMACGLPIVATNVGGVPEVVAHKDTGYLTDPDDEPALVESLLSLSGDDAARQRMGNRARQFVAEQHALNRLPGRLQELYEAALQ